MTDSSMPDDRSKTGVTDSRALRVWLMAPSPTQRVAALHALAMRAERSGAHGEAAEFALRGIPYYDPNDPYFRQWVAKAMSYWEALHERSQSG